MQIDLMIASIDFLMGDYNEDETGRKTDGQSNESSNTQEKEAIWDQGWSPHCRQGGGGQLLGQNKTEQKKRTSSACIIYVIEPNSALPYTGATSLAESF